MDRCNELRKQLEIKIGVIDAKFDRPKNDIEIETFKKRVEDEESVEY